jgi:hypothetical protein
MLLPKVDVTASSNELLRDCLMPIYGSEVECRVPILVTKINVTVSLNELLSDGRMPIYGSDTERHRSTSRS